MNTGTFSILRTLIIIVISTSPIFSVKPSPPENPSEKFVLLTPESIVAVNHFVQQQKDTEISGVAIAAERKTIEYLNNSGIIVLSPLIRTLSTGKALYTINGTVSKKDSTISVLLSLYNSSDKIKSSGSIDGTFTLFRSLRNVLGSTVAYTLGIGDSTHHLATRPINNAVAYALFLKARQYATADQYDLAVSCLKKAVGYDSLFAMGYWAIGKLYEQKGGSDSAMLWISKATSIGVVNPRWSYRDSIDKENHLKELLAASRKQPFESVDDGLRSKQLYMPRQQLTVLLWIIDPEKYTIDLRVQKSENGDYINNFFHDNTDILALNGGFFEMSCDWRLSPSGLIVQNKKILNPLTETGGSGLFCIHDGKAGIRWAKEKGDFSSYDIALQCGPVLVEAGAKMGVYTNDYVRLNRSAVGIAGNNVVMIIVSGEEGTGLSLYELAEFLRTPADNGGADCDAALNLDGGLSTQACFGYKGVAIHIQGLWRINNALVVRKKS